MTGAMLYSCASFASGADVTIKDAVSIDKVDMSDVAVSLDVEVFDFAIYSFHGILEYAVVVPKGSNGFISSYHYANADTKTVSIMNKGDPYIRFWRI